MSPPHNAANDAAKPTNREALGMSLLLPEPEVLRAELTQIGCRTLADIIAKQIAANEPLLIADRDGAAVIVREIAGGGKFRVTVEAV